MRISTKNILDWYMPLLISRAPRKYTSLVKIRSTTVYVSTYIVKSILSLMNFFQYYKYLPNTLYAHSFNFTSSSYKVIDQNGLWAQ